ncbi:predicted protein, partial [Postia placenta Mad-698-R]
QADVFILGFVLIYLILRISRHILVRVVFKSPLDNVPGPPALSFANGNIPQLYDRNGWDFIKDLNEKYDGVVKIHGSYGVCQGILMIPYHRKANQDPSEQAADQYIYERSDETMMSTHLLVGDGLITSQGERHRKQRKLMNPVFSVGHMREMMPIFYRITHDLPDAIASRVDSGAQDIDILDWMARTALELVGQAGLGYSFDPLIRDKADAYAEALKALITRLQRMREISDAMDAHSKRIFEQKKQALAQGDEAVLNQTDHPPGQ